MKKLTIILLLIYASISHSEESLKSEESKTVSLLFNLNQGNFLFAPNTKIYSEFNTVSLGYINKKNNNWTPVYSLDYMFNNSNSKFYSVYGGLGYTFNPAENIRIIPSGSLGISLYREQSANQNVSTFGKDIQFKTQIIYNTSESMGLTLNLQWNRIMISNGYSPKDPSQEMVYDYTTIGFGVVWEL